MSWLKRLHEDHLEVLNFIVKLDGNIKDIELSNQVNENVIWDLKKFSEIITTELIPHFKLEEENIYTKAASVNKEQKKFIDTMLEEHKKLFQVFHDFNEGVQTKNFKQLSQHGKVIVSLLKGHIEKEEKLILSLLPEMHKP